MGLDPKTTSKVFEQVVRMRDAGIAVLLVEQNARRALETADVGCVLDLGRVHITGPAPELLADPQLAELYLGGRPADRDERGEGSPMTDRTLRIIMNGVTGRMGHRQHLVRSVLAIRDEGGIERPDGSRLQVEPVLVGRNRDKLADLADRYGIAEITTDLDEALADDTADVYFDALVTSERKKSILKALAAGKHVYTEKPLAESVGEGLEIAEAGAAAGTVNGVVHDKIFLPGLMKLKRLVDGGFFGRILSVRGEFGYWVFEGDWIAPQRPSWNYRAADGGGMVLDMFCHWNYVFEHLFGRVDSVIAKAVTHIPERWDEQGNRYDATADDAAYAIFEIGDVVVQMNSSWAVRVDRKELVEFQVDGTHGSAVAGLFGCRVQPRVRTPKPVWNPDQPTDQDFRSPVGRGAGQRGLPQRVPCAVGAVPPRRRRRPAAPLRLHVGGARAGAGRGRAPVLGRGPTGAAGDPHMVTPRPAGRRRRLAHAPARRRRASGSTTRAGSRAVRRSPRPTSWPIRAGTTRRARPPELDWDATLAFRRELFRYGFGVAEAMDTAQRNMGLDWPATQELIRRSAAQAREHGARIASGAGTDHRPGATTVDQVADAYAEQVEYVEFTGSQVILMASRQLAATAHARRRLPQGLRPDPRPGPRAGDPALAGRGVRPAAARLLGQRRRRRRHRHVPRAGRRARRRRSTASRCRCSPPSTRPSCGPRCRRASGSTPATTSTTPS